MLDQLSQRGQLALRYATCHDGLTDLAAPLPFPQNPNGSQANVAGICDETGRMFGLMPHPERHIHRTQHPHWTRRSTESPADGLPLFRNAIEYFA